MRGEQRPLGRYPLSCVRCGNVFFPVGDSPNPVQFKAWVNYGLLAANVGIFVLITLPMMGTPVDPGDPRVAEYLRILVGALPPGVSPAEVARQMTEYDLFVFEHGFKPAAPEISDLLASMFLHGGFMHLAGNMLFLWIYGDNVEHRLGRVAYLAAYLGTGLAATLTFAMFASTSQTPLVGASGAISGVLGLYFLFFPRNVVKVFVFLFPFIMNFFWIRARWVLGFYVVIDNILPFVWGSSSNVAYGAHLGGFFAGLGVAWLVEASGGAKPAFAGGGSGQAHTAMPEPLKGVWSADAGDPSIGGGSALPEALTPVVAALRSGDMRRAVGLARTLDPSVLGRLDSEDLYRVARGLAESGYDQLAGRTLRRALARAARDEARSSTIHLALGELRLAQGQPAAAYQHLLLVLELAPNSSKSRRAEAALQALAARGEVQNRW